MSDNDQKRMVYQLSWRNTLAFFELLVLVGIFVVLVVIAGKL